ncbi:MAG: Bax inhibitor-1/YccA family protein, partial [Bacteroidetes bacterium]|nr:Bax inhibitor-1/YccA family protein [Bacteroidota bacterium]
MNLFKSGNPTLSEKSFEQTLSQTQGDTMTVRGTMNKFGFLMLMVMAGAFFAWNWFNAGKNIGSLMMFGALGGFGVALMIIFKKQWSGYLAPAYAILEGLFVGAISAYFNFLFQEKYPDIIMHAVLITFGVAAGMYLLYSLQLIR